MERNNQAVAKKKANHTRHQFQAYPKAYQGRQLAQVGLLHLLLPIKPTRHSTLLPILWYSRNPPSRVISSFYIGKNDSIRPIVHERSFFPLRNWSRHFTPKFRQSASKNSLSRDLEAQVKELKRQRLSMRTALVANESECTRRSQAQHDFLNSRMYIAEQETERTGKALTVDTTYVDLC